MEFDHLRGFYYAAKLGSFTEAASRLFVTQPAVSLQVKALEKELGERLFDRVGRTIRLTHAGRVLYKHVGELIAKLNEIHRTVDEIKSVERGRLDLGASDTTSLYFLPGLLKAFVLRHSKVDVSVTSLMSSQVAQKVLDRELDMGIVTIGETCPRLEVIPLFCQQLVCITCKDHPLAARKLVSVDDIATEPMIALERHSLTRQQVDEYLRDAKELRRPVLEFSNFEIIKCYVAAGLGIALVPEVAACSSSAKVDVSVVRLRKPPTMQVGVVFRKDRDFSLASRAFLAMAKEHFRPTEVPASSGVSLS